MNKKQEGPSKRKVRERALLEQSRAVILSQPVREASINASLIFLPQRRSSTTFSSIHFSDESKLLIMNAKASTRVYLFPILHLMPMWMTATINALGC